MRASTIARRIKEGKRQPKAIPLATGTKIQFVDAGGNRDYISYLRFEDEYGRYLGALDPQLERKQLRQLQRWVNKCLNSCELKR